MLATALPLLKSRTPLDWLKGLGERLSSPAGRPNVFWCILIIKLQIFECLNDKEFPVFVVY